MDGRLLAETMSLNATCPQVLYPWMIDKCGMTMEEILCLTAAPRDVECVTQCCPLLDDLSMIAHCIYIN